jgi:hypothetical protein
MGKFEPGQAKPPRSGRATGTRNKRGQELAVTLEDLKFDVPSRLATLLPKLTLEKQAEVLMGLMGYLYPKLKAVEQIHVLDDAHKHRNPPIITFVPSKSQIAEGKTERQMTWDQDSGRWVNCRNNGCAVL